MKQVPLSHYRGAHAGADVAVLGSGPSLHRINPFWLDDKVVIAVNAAVLKVRKPDYFFTSDGGVVSYNYWQVVQDGTFPVVAGSEGAGEHVTRDGGLDEDREVCFFQKRDSLDLDPAADALVFGQTSPHCAVHFARVLGARRIIVFGCDCQYEGNVTHFHDYPNEPACWTGSEWHQREALRHKGPGEFAASLNYWRLLRDANPDVKIEAWGGLLVTVFPKYQGD